MSPPKPWGQLRVAERQPRSSLDDVAQVTSWPRTSGTLSFLNRTPLSGSQKNSVPSTCGHRGGLESREARLGPREWGWAPPEGTWHVNVPCSLSQIPAPQDTEPPWESVCPKGPYGDGLRSVVVRGSGTLKGWGPVRGGCVSGGPDQHGLRSFLRDPG